MEGSQQEHTCIVTNALTHTHTHTKPYQNDNTESNVNGGGDCQLPKI